MTSGRALLLIGVLALTAPHTDRRPDPCVQSDGPQFRCWLERRALPETR